MMADSPSSRRVRTPLVFLDATGSDDELGPSVENGIHVYTTLEYDRQICRNRGEFDSSADRNQLSRKP